MGHLYHSGVLTVHHLHVQTQIRCCHPHSPFPGGRLSHCGEPFLLLSSPMTFVTTISGVGNLISAQYPTCGFTVGIVSGDIILASRWAKSGLVLAPTPYTSLPSPGSLVSNHFPTPAKNQSDPRGGCPVWRRPNPILPRSFPSQCIHEAQFSGAAMLRLRGSCKP